MFLVSLLFILTIRSYGQEKEIGQLLNKWHLAAAHADLEAYFEFMADDGYYLGTDQFEVWTKDEFYGFCKPYFDQKKTWDFTVERRKIFLTEDKKTAWFEEVLSTWMGSCRGSGVLVLTEEGWKLKQYNLAVLVSNDDIQDYLKILKEK
ncbi:nuclear transport factor 2 family protein [Reichenbachiella agarivorans]|uniref:Nuclear transport factor 2 family protein n=1 Tax=Reichenbachiella agarivorans TaxID=2979464 RepID=A0ABY6CLB5_9BACT|nr:nuclear transport factor 2 family protein [Reichenbachiella agarivorans]UXP31307.1 nuclear transport factor 2 family protein [Reichenbachiella agarivorans]